jgi:hypothetical protein
MDTEPEADLETADGQLLYSAPQLAKREAWTAAKLRRELTQELAPAMEVARERQADRDQRQYVTQAVESYRPMVTELQAMPGFAEHKAEILQRQQALFDTAVKARQPVDPLTLAVRAYREIVPAKLQALRDQQLTASAVAKAAGRDANPAAVHASPPPSPKTMADALKQFGVY